MTRVEICSYLRGRLQLRVQTLEDGTYQLSPLPRDVGTGKWKGEPEIWDLRELCRQYGIPLQSVGLESATVCVSCGKVRFPEAGPCERCGHVEGDKCQEDEDGEPEPAGESFTPPVGPESPRYLPLGALDQRPCPATFDGYLCTRGAGHRERETGSAGDHAAHNLSGEMVRRWPQVFSSDGT